MWFELAKLLHWLTDDALAKILNNLVIDLQDFKFYSIWNAFITCVN